MGMFIDHGIEYAGDTHDGDHVIMVHSHSLDRRLAESAYFRARRETWFTPALNKNFVKVDDDVDVDIVLTPEEKDRVETALRERGYEKTFTRWGWYETVSVSSTMDIK